ncbi:MAG: response regulator [Patescibacteria group bacterium]
MQKILIVEDEEKLGKIYRGHLERSGFEARLSPTISSVRDFSPDLILLDHGLPDEELDGIELIPQTKKRFPEAKIVVFSNYSPFELRDRALAAGADDYWVKVDLSLKNLLERVQTLLGS